VVDWVADAADFTDCGCAGGGDGWEGECAGEEQEEGEKGEGGHCGCLKRNEIRSENVRGIRVIWGRRSLGSGLYYLGSRSAIKVKLYEQP